MKNEKLTEKQIFEIERDIQKNAAGRRLTRSTNGKMQTRSTGKRGVRNLFGHAVGTIGADIDAIIRHAGLSGRYSKNELAALTGTKESKINSHLNNELAGGNKDKPDYGLQYSVNKNGKLEYSFKENSIGSNLLKTSKNYRF